MEREPATNLKVCLRRREPLGVRRCIPVADTTAVAPEPKRLGSRARKDSSQLNDARGGRLPERANFRQRLRRWRAWRPARAEPEELFVGQLLLRLDELREIHAERQQKTRQ